MARKIARQTGRAFWAALTAVPFFGLNHAFAAQPTAPNPGVVEVRDLSSYTQIVAISDVHGEYEHALTLLRNAGILDAKGDWAAGRTLMVVVGDSIDKGPKSVEVLRLWMRLQPEATARGGRLIVLLGNHEAEFLANPADVKSEETRRDVTADHLATADLTDTAKPLGAFLHALPLAARIGNWVFCHAGWVPDEPWQAFTAQAKTTLGAGNYRVPFLLGDDSILEKKTSESGKKWWRSKKEIAELERRLDADGLSGVVFGHRPTGLDIPNNVGTSIDGRMFKIDSGMAPLDADGSGGDAGQPYPGHLLLFPHPAQLQAATVAAGKRIDALSVDSQGHRAPVPVAPER